MGFYLSGLFCNPSAGSFSGGVLWADERAFVIREEIRPVKKGACMAESLI